MNHIMRAFETAAFIPRWFGQAMMDGRISVHEMATFITEIGRIWKIQVHIDIPGELGRDVPFKGHFEREET